MKVEVTDKQKNHYVLEIEESASPQDFKNRFRQEYNQDIDNCKLIYKGREIKDDKKFSDYSIIEGSKIALLESKFQKREEVKIPPEQNFSKPVSSFSQKPKIPEPNFPQNISSSSKKPQISSEPNFPQPISSGSQKTQNSLSDLTPLQRLSRDLMSPATDELVCQLIMMGFDPELSKQVLIQTNGNLEDSVEILIAQTQYDQPTMQVALDNINNVVDQFMSNPQFQRFIVEIATSPDQYERVISQLSIQDPNVKTWFLINKEAFIEACKKRVIMRINNTQRNRIEEIPDQPIKRQNQGQMGGGMGGMFGMGGMSGIESLSSLGTLGMFGNIGGMGGIDGMSGMARMGMDGSGMMSGLGGLENFGTGKMDRIMNRGSDKFSELNKKSSSPQESDEDSSISGEDSLSSDIEDKNF
ncbi:unnamed protein product [Blepharisma stoltei]|uniref:Ubiquitin-like domain-containing protein n=1 Tax=Blepharisma stoltei TaxID=1481888 RepID=A0AAU9J6C3_9CILI|nr:unnamed protein product [Blepharisma stoltei]